MDPFDEILGGMRAASSHYAQFQLRAPWGVRYSTGTQAWLVVAARGRCWLRWDGREAPLLLEAGGCLIIKPGVVFDLSDAGQREVRPCQSLPAPRAGGVVEHGGAGEPTELIFGRFSFDPVAAEPLVTLLPPLVHVPLGEAHAALLQGTLAVMGRETAQDGLGARFVIERLTDVLFVQAVRALFSSGCDLAPRWVSAQRDRRVAKAIRAVHADLARPWTVAAMAREAGVSRSTFAAAFTSAVGESPLDYVTSWRLYRAKVLLSSTDHSLTEIATRVGYDSDTALSRAFKRRVGVPPGAFRRALAARLGGRRPEAMAPTLADPPRELRLAK